MNATQELIELVAAKLGDPALNPPSLNRIGKALNVSGVHISRLRNGQDHMSRELFARVARLLDLPPARISSFAARIMLDATPNDDTGRWMRLRMNFETGDTVKKVGKISSITGAAILAVLSMHPVPLKAATYEPSANAVHSDSLYIMRSRSRRKLRDAGRKKSPWKRPLRPRRTVIRPFAA